MLAIVDKVIKTAESQVGYVEGKNNWNKYAAYFDKPIKDGGAWQFFNTHKQNSAYCAVGLHWCMIQHASAAKVRQALGEPTPKNNCGAGVKYLHEYLKAKDAKKLLAPGAFIFFETTVKGKKYKYGHVELITRVDSKIHTVGFNKSGKVNVKECSYAKNNAKISDYLMPLYEKIDTAALKELKDEYISAVASPVPAASFNKIFNKKYHTTKAVPLLNLRKPSQTICEVPAGAAVRCYGFFTSSFLYVVYKGKKGYVNVNYLR